VKILLSLLFVLAADSAFAQGWPAKSLRWIVPYPPGGSTDIAARAVGERVAQYLGQPVVIENRAGAGGNIGFELAAKSAPDGYTAVIAPDSAVSNPHIYRNIGFQTIKDFIPVIQLARQPVVLAVHPSIGVNSVAELVALAKAKPGLGFATSGAGSQQHMTFEWFAKMAGFQPTHIPYKGGSQAVADLVGGQVTVGSLGSSPLIPHYKAGKLKLLAQSTKTRAPSLPEIPTYEESGYPGLVLDQWLGVLVPARTPAEAVARLNAEIGRALAEPVVRERFALSALEPIGGSSEQFAKLVRDDYEKYAKLVKDLNIRAE
jgi:tripartite-type tricarboxylate transporter receptor subunit TctC